MRGSTGAESALAAFEDFYRSRAPGLFLYASAVAGPALAEDACQEAWLRMWRAWGNADVARIDAWARQVVRNCCLDRREAQAQAQPAIPDVDTPDSRPAPEELVLRRAEAVAIGEHIRRLPQHLRDVLWYREIVGLSYAEIARTLEIPMGTVMSRLHAARRKLARRLVG